MLVITRMGLLTGNYGTFCQKVIHHSLLVAIFIAIEMVVVPGRLTRVVTLHHVVCGRHWG